VVSRAYKASKNKLISLTKFGDDYVSKGEFTFLLEFLRRYANYWYVFEQIDTTKDHRISKEEFLKAVPLLREKGMKLDDPIAIFHEIDPSNRGFILFDEFCHYVNLKKIDLTGL
jgi:Ca2+-binding EF-hand superfamily protein